MDTGTAGKFTEKELLLGIHQADRVVFTYLYSQNFRSLLSAAMRYVKDTSVAEEIIQDVFLKLWERPGDILNVKSLKPYLYKLVINQSLNQVNRDKNIAQHHLRIAEETSDEYIENLIEDQSLQELLNDEIERLPDQCKRVFKLSRFENLKYREIALQLNIAEKTVENHIVTALKILRARLLDESPRSNDPSYRIKMLSLLFGLSLTHEVIINS